MTLSSEGMSDLGLRILAELPDTLDQDIAKALKEDFDAETDHIADVLVATLNEGQRWRIAKASIAQRVDQKRRRLVRHYETRAAVPRRRSSGISTAERQLREDRHARDCAELGLPVETDRAEVIARSMRKALEDFQQSIRLEVTAELLASEFAVGDGTRTTWGEATAEQHLARAALLERQGFGTLETAARHRAAVEMLSSSGSITLSEIRAAA